MQSTTTISPNILEALGTLDALENDVEKLLSDLRATQRMAADLRNPEPDVDIDDYADEVSEVGDALEDLCIAARDFEAKIWRAHGEAEDGYDDARTEHEQLDALIAAVLDHERGLADWGDVLRIARLNS